jgi:hypothetical protein
MRFRQTVAVLGLVLFSLYGVVNSYRAAFELEKAYVSAYETRLTKVKRALPAREVVGYVTDDACPPDEAQARLAATRYVLAPTLIADDVNRRLVIGDFHGPDAARQRANKQLQLVEEFDQGVQLLRSREP